MEASEGQNDKQRDLQEQHRRLAVILESEDAEVVRTILHHLYQRVCRQRSSDQSAEPDSSR